MPDEHTAAAHDLIVLGRALASLAVSIGVRAGAMHDDDGGGGHAASLRESAGRMRDAASQLDGIADRLARDDA